jgi:hypothetical protein
VQAFKPNIGSKIRQIHASISRKGQNFAGKSIASGAPRGSKTFHRWRAKWPKTSGAA